ncbi:uncharacterized protein LOC129614933 [Condylostylus longicornis]|uniref:uncharacterized protein LOC129614933 n=1 Tax=Condylostylus longicornis TaxID=2530218 RepID=UPI00244DB2F3|nr:uncharacterized protein LOC129614933 [Condylostylus longicornis]
MMQNIIKKTDEFQERDSGWALIKIIHLEINVNEYKPLRGSQYLPLPLFIKNKKACINIMNSDEYCFKWSVAAAFHTGNHPERTSTYKIRDIRAERITLENNISLKFDGLTFPLKVSDIKIFEELNSNISINVFGYEKVETNDNTFFQISGPYYCTTEKKVHHINLLLIENEEKSHYVYIKNISRLIASQISKHKGTDLKQHEPECNRIVTSMPKNENKILKFKNFGKKMVVPFAIYADFECILENIDTCSPDPKISSTIDIQQHVPCSYAYYIKCSYDDNLDEFRMQTNPGCENDFHLENGNINVIPINKENYISLSKWIEYEENKFVEIRFLDSFRFMDTSLELLASYLSDSDLLTVRKMFTDVENFSLVRRKGIFPYEYLNSWEKLNDTTLPSKIQFNNSLLDSVYSDEDYAHAERVWEKFECKSLRDYLELYLKIDVLLLTDIFQNFRQVCLKIYSLDPCQYFTAPGLAWDSMLKTTKIELELLTDINMHNFIKRGIRGGLTQCSLRHSVANNKYLENYDANKPSQYIMYLDVNNLYGLAQSEYLPHSNFKWCKNVDIDVSNISDDSEIGYILEVDLEYPSSLHVSHNDLPFCAENKQNSNMKQKKLVADLEAKKKYIIHYRNLKHCLKHGLILKKIYRVLEFNQSRWLKSFIDLNNFHRTRATNDFQKNFFKKQNNANYGKTMENVDKRKDVKIVTDWESSGRRLGARA